MDDKKLEWAKGFGAAHTINSRETDAVQAIQELTDGNGANVVVDAVGRPGDHHAQGWLPLEKFVTETIGLDDIEEAFHRMERGEVLRSVVVL